MEPIQINLSNSYSYEIYISYEKYLNLPELIIDMYPFKDIVLLFDGNVYDIYGKEIIESFKSIFPDKDILNFRVTPGEKSKSLEMYETIFTFLLENQKQSYRDYLIINIGGGVVGDLGGFIAATYKRGIDYIQVPTTLLSMVDSGIGGKTAINYGNIKNILGSFYQPSYVFADIKFLDTLNDYEYQNGLAELIKTSIIAGGEFFDYIEKNYIQIKKGNPKEMEYAIHNAYSTKGHIVQEDEFDNKDIRIKLNFGHTFAHAIEGVTGYEKYSHGEAVAIGMYCAVDLSKELAMINPDIADRIIKLMRLYELPDKVTGCSINSIIDKMYSDKKNKKDTNRFILIEDIGKLTVAENISRKLLEKIIKNHYVPQ